MCTCPFGTGPVRFGWLASCWDIACVCMSVCVCACVCMCWVRTQVRAPSLGPHKGSWQLAPPRPLTCPPPPRHPVAACPPATATPTLWAPGRRVGRAFRGRAGHRRRRGAVKAAQGRGGPPLPEGAATRGQAQGQVCMCVRAAGGRQSAARTMQIDDPFRRSAWWGGPCLPLEGGGPVKAGPLCVRPETPCARPVRPLLHNHARTHTRTHTRTHARVCTHTHTHTHAGSCPPPS